MKLLSKNILVRVLESKKSNFTIVAKDPDEVDQVRKGKSLGVKRGVVVEIGKEVDPRLQDKEIIYTGYVPVLVEDTFHVIEEEEVLAIVDHG